MGEPLWSPSDDDFWPVQDIRCEADHRDGGVCQRVVWRDEPCPGQGDHAGQVTT